MANIKDVKTVILGNSGVGKSSFLHRFIKNEFKYSLEMTSGVGFSNKIVEINSS